MVSVLVTGSAADELQMLLRLAEMAKAIEIKWPHAAPAEVRQLQKGIENRIAQLQDILELADSEAAVAEARELGTVPWAKVRETLAGSP